MPQFLRLLSESPGLKRVAPAIAKEALPCVRLISKCAREGAIEIGASKLGGLPDLPDASEWPCRDGAPLSFLAQINVTCAAEILWVGRATAEYALVVLL
jgi:uncharacterized protein YwqG